ncbi:RNA polymerase II subunit A [Chytridium lagenaria]|nr:RNA polymerase II subunit A [Chytridium lagenaria]
MSEVQPPPPPPHPMVRTMFAVICASNQNRSMEAHHVLAKNGFMVSSYGTGSAVRLPGPAFDKPNIYAFGTPYDDIYRDLYNKDTQLYTQNGLLQMLDRNRRTKRAPEQWQEWVKRAPDQWHECFDAVCEELLNRGSEVNIPVHVINLEIKDNHEEAAVGGKLFLQLATMIEQARDKENDMSGILEEFQSKTNANLLYSICYF